MSNSKGRAFMLGMKSMTWAASSLPYAFLAGIMYGFRVYGNAMEAQARENDRREDWKKRAEAGTWRPEK